jgi:hypothetical protein
MKFLILLISSLLLCCAYCPDEKAYNEYFYKKICLEGHVYYKTAAYSGLAIKLDDDGKPCPCKEE